MWRGRDDNGESEECRAVDNGDLFNSHVDFGLHSTTYPHMKEQRVRLENVYGVSGIALSCFESHSSVLV